LCRPIIHQIFGRKFNLLSFLHLSHFSHSCSLSHNFVFLFFVIQLHIF
jgi:hypothetical protein